MTPSWHFAALQALLTATSSIAALALPPAPLASGGPPWAIKFPGLVNDVNVYAKPAERLSAVCFSPKVQTRASEKRLDFERVATGDKALYALVAKQAFKPTLNEVVVRLRTPASGKTCAVRLKNVLFAHYAIEAPPKSKVALERFTLAYSEAAAIP